MADLISVEEARRRILDGARRTAAEEVPVAAAGGRVLAADLFARRTQPPFDASAMDGYAVRAADVAAPPACLAIVAEVAAGEAATVPVGPGEAARIFTGAPIPAGADAVLIQENARREGEAVVALEPVAPGRHVRRRGLDFAEGERLLPAGTRLSPAALGLAAAANHPFLSVARRPRVGVLATGDELVPPGTDPGPDRIVASNFPALAALVAEAGGEAIDLGIAPDDTAALGRAIATARGAGLDVLVTVGGASVGEHDLVRATLAEAGMRLAFWRIAMRPGKPLMSGDLDGLAVLGLPGNPVSSLVCGALFLAPLVARLAGVADATPPLEPARLGAAVPANGEREDYMRARTVGVAPDGLPEVVPFDVQDSSMLSLLAAADVLLVRPPGAPAAAAGDPCRVLRLARR